MPPKAPETLILRRPVTGLSKRDLRLLFIATGLIIVVMVWFFFMLAGDREIDWPAAGPKLLDKLVGMGRLDRVIELVAGVFVTWYVVRSMRYERLILDASGIRYQSPLPAALARMQPSWSHSWAQIRSAEIVLPGALGGPGFVLMTLDAVTVKRRIAGRWVAEGAAEQARASPFSFWRRPADTALLEAEQSPLLQFMRRTGVQVTVQTKTGAFALESNPVALAAAVAVPVLLLYAAVDLVINTEVYAARPPYELIAGGAVLAFFLAVALLARSGVPGAETVGLSLLLGIAGAAALYPGLLRLNQLTDSDGLRAHEYRLKQAALWVPAEKTLPELAFTDYYEYWSQFKPGARKEFLLRKGGLGFYQVEMEPVNAEMRAYYRKNP